MGNFYAKAILAACTLFAVSCRGGIDNQDAGTGIVSLESMAKIISELPLSQENLDEVFDAVNSSSGNGYDEEYMMSNLFSSPGSGVGDKPTKAAARYSRPLRELLTSYFEEHSRTKAGAADVQRYIDALSESDIQIYWPFSEFWDGREYPIVTFDPGNGAESNYGYELAPGKNGFLVVDSVLVTEAVAKDRPVWVINRNDDSAFTPFDMSTKASEKEIPSDDGKILTVKKFRMLRQYDSWFGGASEFKIQCGAVDGFRATTEEDLRKYAPTVTDFVIVVKRSQLGNDLPLDIILLTDYTPQMDKIAFLITEDDGGTTTSWKCSANVKYNSKSYGFDIDLPYKDKDDVVWRGQIAHSFFDGKEEVSGRFGDVVVTFGLE